MYDQEWEVEKTERHLAAAATLPFGVSYLDDALLRLMPGELMVIGARTGLGKTELATNLALQFSDRQKRVVFFSLESEKWEIQRRLKYRKMAQLFEEHYRSQIRMPRYREWLQKGFESDWDSIEKFAEKELSLQTANLSILYRNDSYSVEKFLAEFQSLQNDADVFIIDHLHYFDLTGQSEFEGLKKSIHAIRNASIGHGKPIVLLAHLRKDIAKSENRLPTLDDFHGHSDIVKVATTVLLLSSARNANVSPPQGTFPTYFQIAKCRTAAEVCPYAAIVSFDTKKNSYSGKYFLVEVKNGEPIQIENADDIPLWAVNAIRPLRRYVNE